MNSEGSSNSTLRTFCAYCGQQIIPNAQYCSYCGKAQTCENPKQEIKLTVGNDVSSVKISVSNPVQKGTVLRVLVFVFSFLTLISLILMHFIKFKTNYIMILAFEGAKRSDITHDMRSFSLWFVGLIIVGVLLVATIVFYIFSIIVKKDYSSWSAYICIFLILSLIAYYTIYLKKLPDQKEHYEIVKILDEKKTSKKFVPYDKRKDS